MTATLTTPAAGTDADRAVTTDRLLLAGAVSAPLWSVVALTQAATRSDFDFSYEPLSLLATGSLGWIQIANFLIGGLLVVLGAVGLRRSFPRSRALAGAWGLSGVLLAAAGVFSMDPVGTPGLSWHAVGHMITGTLSFLALTVTCLLLAGRMRREGHAVAAGVSVLAAVGVVAGNAWAVTGGAHGSITLGVGVMAAMLRVSGVCLARR
ncbi:DUF998 domain-containing protein [Actinomycetospora endophytica]|uniref:DUF998 domain-containing protein n=1 Tax=Actinomycetospora endophytica TaxID=2291215 RepID=A0ABS8PGR3_9PSEU|nr:DUF998 domain-containing protein [Actinomycetospora endophytica]MCD2196586.1 DUF998 domain-containing protein [Actinomycetospora endophytica]